MPKVSSVSRSTVVAFAAGFAGVNPMATDIYLVIMPAIARYFDATLAATHASMAAFALGFGVSQLFVGVLADRYGRRPVAIGGAILFFLTTFAVVAAPTLEILTACRFVQGMMVATYPILSRAIVRDAVPPERAAGTYALVHAMAALAPLTAPFMAAWAMARGGWQAAMALLLIYGLVMAVAIVARLPETRPQLGLHEITTPFAAARQVLSHPRFVFGCTITFLLYAALFTWLSTSPFLMIDQLGFSPVGAAIVLGLASLGYMAGSLGTVRLSVRHSPERLVALGAPLMLAGTIACMLVLTRTRPAPWTILIAMLPFYVGLGFTHANALQIVMRPFPHMAGQASAWLGLMQQLGGVLVSLLAVKLGAGLAAVGVMIACCSALLLVSAVAPLMSRAKPPLE